MTGLSSALLHTEAEEFHSLDLTETAGIAFIARLNDSHADVRGRAFLLNLDYLIARLGESWEARAPFVWAYLAARFDERLNEPNWCAQVSDNAWMAVTITVGPRSGALKCVEIWHEAVAFFLGADVHAPLALFEVIVESPTRLRLRPASHDTFAHTPPAAANSASFTASTVHLAGRILRVACTLEPVFELKQLAMIGNRLEPVVSDAIAINDMDSRALQAMDWQDREEIDLKTIALGLTQLQARSEKDRKMLMVVPVAFSTLASTRGRARAMAEISRAATDLKLKVLIEIRGLYGVPPHRISEIVHLIKPVCRFVVGTAAPDKRAIQNLKQCGLAGVSLTYDGMERSPGALLEYLDTLGSAAKLATGACMMRGFTSYHQMAVARLAGITHASVKASVVPTGGMPGERQSL